MLEKIFTELEKLNKGWEYWESLSSSSTPKEFKSWATKHSNQIKKALLETGSFTFDKVSVGHFYYSMFMYSDKTGWVYVSINDVRLPLSNILIRTAKSNKDYSGGKNNYIELSSEDVFKRTLLSFVAHAEN